MLEIVVDFVRTSRKAIVAFVLTALFTWLKVKGITLGIEVEESIRTLLEALIIAGAVWLVPNKK